MWQGQLTSRAGTSWTGRHPGFLQPIPAASKLHSNSSVPLRCLASALHCVHSKSS